MFLPHGEVMTDNVTQYSQYIAQKMISTARSIFYLSYIEDIGKMGPSRLPLKISRGC